MIILGGKSTLIIFAPRQNETLALSAEKGVIPTGSSIQLYNSLVEPYFRYGNTVWGLCNDNLIDSFSCYRTGWPE